MHTQAKRLEFVIAASLFCALLVGCNDDDKVTNPTPATTRYTMTKLVADASDGGAPTVDANLVNAWGIAFGPTGLLWVANAETGTSTLYDAAGVKQSTTVMIPTADKNKGGAPTGIIFNATSDFKINGTATAAFIFAGEDGVLSAWSAGMTNGVKVADRSSSNAIYKGIAIASDGNANFLFATDFKSNHIDVFNATFGFVKSFTDASIPSGYGPFDITNIDGKLYVTFAKQQGPDNEDDQPGAGLGYVVVFNPDGTVSKRFASEGHLNAPWGIARAPSGFGDFSNAILIGNFGDGKVGAYNASSGAFMGFLSDASGSAIVIDGLWGLTFGPTTTQPTLYFSAGPDDETHGLVGKITVAQ